MSGGSLNYLYCKDIDEIWNYIPEIQEVEEYLLEHGYEDVARDVRRFLEYMYTSRNRIDVLNEQLKPIFKAVEWRFSADYNDDNVAEAVERYRNKE